MKNFKILQNEICKKYGSEFQHSEEDLKVGILLDTILKEPLNALRRPAEGDNCGWYIWGGEEFPEDDNFFQPLHVKQLPEKCPKILPYLGLSSGWRVLLTDDYEDIWFDETLLKI